MAPYVDPVIVTTRTQLRGLIAEVVHEAVNDALSGLEVEGTSEKEWMTNAEAMAYLGVSRNTLARHRSNNALPFSKIGSAVYYRRQDILDLLEARLERGGHS